MLPYLPLSFPYYIFAKYQHMLIRKIPASINIPENDPSKRTLPKIPIQQNTRKKNINPLTGKKIILNCRFYVNIIFDIFLEKVINFF
jgi:hypothetical protein